MILVQQHKRRFSRCQHETFDEFRRNQRKENNRQRIDGFRIPDGQRQSIAQRRQFQQQKWRTDY